MTAEPQGPPDPRWHTTLRAELTAWWPVVVLLVGVVFTSGVVVQQARGAKEQAEAVAVKLDTLSEALKPVAMLAEKVTMNERRVDLLRQRVDRGDKASADQINGLGDKVDQVRILTAAIAGKLGIPIPQKTRLAIGEN